MQEFLHQVASGLAAGGIYASLAIALVLIYRTTSSVNFAQGELAMFSSYMAWFLVQRGLAYWVAFTAVVLGSFVLGMIVQRTLLEPLRERPHLSIIAVSVGLLIVVNSIAGALFGYDLKDIATPFGPSFAFAQPYLSPHQCGVLAVTLAELAGTYAFFRYTRFGLAMRAVAVNPRSAQLAGIRIESVLVLSWGLAAAAGGVAGMLAAPIVLLEPSMMMSPLVYALAGALLGGIANPWGAAAGAFAVGVMENLLGAYVVGDELKLTCMMVLIISGLVLWPAGLFGRRSVTRA
ncbi:MAG TPA: branched-chain amino acid ABC transporter permease [Ramlibacter sp.]|uniref:branched-chain amino acid ABC transporter permease n=1 Tax=Ramlibacter sp. TaxID=1917967 RepID=UPI002D1265E8|nr:branched-chain amino acid ABC transporter permease [Ramlibacter sp.]HVZ44268.1 branched-chain amino acid ABC transporter permease [Ramlibacter sp.]